MPELNEHDALRKARREGWSEQTSGGHAPACMFDLEDDEPAAKLYAAYNRAGTSDTAGLNYQGRPCPVWEDLPENIRVKWRAAAEKAAKLST